MSFWIGPFFVVEVLSDVVYRIQRNARCTSQIVHHNQMKPCFFREERDNTWLDTCIVKYKRKSDKETIAKDISVDEKVESQGPTTKVKHVVKQPVSNSVEKRTEIRTSKRVRQKPDRFGNNISN